jgi:hypothetical protein
MMFDRRVSRLLCHGGVLRRAENKGAHRATLRPATTPRLSRAITSIPELTSRGSRWLPRLARLLRAVVASATHARNLPFAPTVSHDSAQESRSCIGDKTLLKVPTKRRGSLARPRPSHGSRPNPLRNGVNRTPCYDKHTHLIGPGGTSTGSPNRAMPLHGAATQV